MSNAKKAKVDKAVLKTYQARYKQLAIEGLLRAGLLTMWGSSWQPASRQS